MDVLFLVFLGIIAVIVLSLVLGSFFTVNTAQVAIITRFGKFLRVAEPGLNWKVPYFDSVAGTVSLRVNQITLTMETKTKDNVFVSRLHDRVGAKGGRDESDACGRVGGAHRFLHGVENRQAEMRGAALAWSDAANDLGAAGDHLLGVKRPLVAGEALNQDPAVFVDQNAHV